MLSPLDDCLGTNPSQAAIWRPFALLIRERQQDVLQRKVMTRQTAIKMIKRRALNADLPWEISNHSFRGTGITEYLRNGGYLETAAHIAGHESTRTTQLYNRVNEELSLDAIERILV